MRDEIKREFQLERMILFSDAVFAIAMTLMAMDIKLPKEDGNITAAMVPFAILHLLPVIISYTVSFLFIGAIWYEHLKIFSLLKDYDKGLVIRNLLLLFLIGFFPFSTSLITQVEGGMIAFFIYFTIIFLCLIAQYMLYRYIVISKPEIAVSLNWSEHLTELKKRKISLVGFFVFGILTFITYKLIPDPAFKSFSTMWIVVYSIVYAILVKRIKPAKSTIEEIESNRSSD